MSFDPFFVSTTNKKRKTSKNNKTNNIKFNKKNKGKGNIVSNDGSSNDDDDEIGTAQITFKDKESMSKLGDKWSIMYLKDSCRIAPLDVTKEEIDERNSRTLKLTNLPYGTTAYDLHDIIMDKMEKSRHIMGEKDKPQ
ncbi:245_t:CDS:2 [Entrophospora sp. SA101]|nr:245_t:CDS:2 [Entrophospora sp. SA101]